MSNWLSTLRAILRNPRRWLFPLFHVFDRAREERSPERLAAGAVLGLWVGLTPNLTLHWPLLVGAAVCLPWNPAVTLVSALVFSLLGAFTDGAFHALGFAMLSLPALEPFWRLLHDLPLFPFTRFDRTIVAGSFLVCAVATAPLYLLLRNALARHGTDLWLRFQTTQLWAIRSTSWLRRRYHGMNAYGAVDPAAQAPLPPPPARVRPEGLAVVSLALLLLALSMPLAGPSITRSALERFASRFNGAPVRLVGFRIRWWRRTVEIAHVKVRDPRDPNRNLAEVDDVVVRFRWAPLLWRRLHVDSVETHSVRSGVESRAHDEAGRPEARDIGFLDRVGSTFPIVGLRRELKATPLRSLGRLAVSIDTIARTDSLRGGLKTEAQLTGIGAAIDETSARLTREANESAGAEWSDGWRQRWADAEESARGPLREELIRRRPVVEKQLKDLAERLTTLEEQIGAAGSLIDGDVAYLREHLELPRLDSDDLSPELLGPGILSLVDRMSFWVELSRTRFPNRAHRVPATCPEFAVGSLGTPFEFATTARSAAFRVDHVLLRSTDAGTTGSPLMRFEATHLSSDPTSAPGPTVVTFESQLPPEGSQHIRTVLEIDHRGSAERESFEVHIEKYPVSHMLLNRFPDLQVGIERARGALDMRVTYDGDTLRGQWTVEANGADYFVTSKHKQIEETMLGLIDPVASFVFKGTLAGNSQTAKLTGTSELGNRLATGLKREYRNPLLAIDDYLRRLLLDRVDQQQKHLHRRLDEARRRIQDAYDETQRTFASLESAAGLGSAQRVPATPSDPR